jgi:hypothetical protein
MSASEPVGSERCASCGEPATTQLVTELDNVPLCEGCSDHLRAGGAIAYFPPTEEEPPPPPEKRFAELLKAARVLLSDGIAEEDQIYPTLAFANELGQGLVDFIEEKERLVSAWEDDSGSWGEAVDGFSWRHPSIRPVEVVDGVVILERVPVDVRIHNYPLEDVEVPRVVVLSVYPHKRPPTLEQVAARYDKELLTARIPHAADNKGRFEFSFREGYLLIEVHHSRTSIPPEHMGAVFRDGKPEFPHPRLVGGFYNMLLGTTSKDGFARHLVTRRRGPTPPSDTVIPACVAFYLRDYGGMKQGMEAHRLLNEYVLRGHWKKLPEGHSDSASNQLWRDADKVKNKLLGAAYALYWYDPKYMARRVSKPSR